MSTPIDKPKLLAWVKEECPNVSKMKQQLTYDQIDKLESEFTKKEIQEILEAMDNFAPLTKKYLSVYRTARNWLRMARKKAAEKQQYQAKRIAGANAGKFEHSEALTYLERKGIPYKEFENKFDRVKDPNGKTYFTLKG